MGANFLNFFSKCHKEPIVVGTWNCELYGVTEEPPSPILSVNFYCVEQG